MVRVGKTKLTSSEIIFGTAAVTSIVICCFPGPFSGGACDHCAALSLTHPHSLLP
jgi:hypothetical protein